MPLTDKQVKELLAKLLAKRMVEICTAISFDPTTDTSLPPQGRWVYLDTVKKSFEILTDELEQAEREAIGQGRKLKITSNQLQDLANTSKTCFDGGNHLFWQNLANNLNEYFAAPRPEASTRELPLEKWWHEIHAHLERPSTSSGIPIDPPLLNGCTREIWDALEYMDYKTFLRAKELTEAVVEVGALAAQPEQEKQK